MKIQTKNNTAIGIALILIIAMLSSSLMIIPTVQALELEMKLLLNINPNPVGVGQTVYVNAFFTHTMPTSTGFYGDRHENITIVVERPNGVKDTYGPFMADSTGGTWCSFVPTEAGNYTAQAFYPGQILTGTNPLAPTLAPGFDPSMGGAGGNLELIGSHVKAATSEKITFVVQDEPVLPKYVTPPLPTEYWSRPIYSTNYNWAQLGGNWFGETNVQLYSQAPNTGHILWTKPTHFGGQVGEPIKGDQESQYMSTSLLVTYFTPLVLNGILFNNKYASSNSKVIGWEAIDLRTGETLWTRTAGETGAETMTRVQALNWHTIQEYGCTAYIWSSSGSSLRLYDAMTGVYLANITGAQNQLNLVDYDCTEQGTFLGWYTTSNATGTYLNLWNSTRCIAYPYGQGPYYMPQNVSYQSTIRPSGNIGFDKGIMWTVRLDTAAGIPTSIALKTLDVILLRSAPTVALRMSAGYQVTAGYDAKTGEKLWGPLNQSIPMDEDINVACSGDGVYVLTSKTSHQAWGYSLKTGQKLWGPVQLKGNAFSHLSNTGACAYGMAYISDFGGYVNAIDLQTGKLNWTFTRGSSGYDTPFGIYPLWYFSVGSIGDGKIFLSEGHVYDPPLFPAGQQLAINATTGELVWSIMACTIKSTEAIADGMITTWNSYDNQIYVFGKGQTATTVSIQDDVVAYGDRVLIKGTVMDESPGTKNADRVARFPHGVPAIADEFMSPWMEYVYMQQTKPTNATGVPVTLSAIDANGNYREIGTTTTDINGNFNYVWDPDIEGLYTVTATFGGSESYWPSNAQTAFVVTAPEPTASPYPEIALPPTEMYFIGSTIAIIIAIAIVGLLILRKKQ
jgi:hypothetical protein